MNEKIHPPLEDWTLIHLSSVSEKEESHLKPLQSHLKVMDRHAFLLMTRFCLRSCEETDQRTLDEVEYKVGFDDSKNVRHHQIQTQKNVYFYETFALHESTYRKLEHTEFEEQNSHEHRYFP